MLVFRLGKTQYSNDLQGEGARLFGGRWNPVGVSCLYSSASRALAVLEFSVNVSVFEIPKSVCFTVLEIPDELIFKVDLASLPNGWNSFPVSSTSRLFGGALLTADHAIIQLPSSIIHNEFNFLLNPNHPKKAHFKILDIEPFQYDERIKSTL